MDLFGEPLEDLVFSTLSNKVVEKYDKKFFDVLTAYSFEKSNLKINEHFFPWMHVSSVLDSFARHPRTVDLVLLDDAVSNYDDSEALLGFCDAVLFFSGLLPEAFGKRIVSVGYYQKLARQGFRTLHMRTTRDSYFNMMSNYFDRYSGALSFMRKNLLPESFLREEELLIQ